MRTLALTLTLTLTLTLALALALTLTLALALALSPSWLAAVLYRLCDSTSPPSLPPPQVRCSATCGTR